MGLSIFGNTTDAPRWQPEPNSRGTWAVVQSCVITLVLCVYSAVHLNIPEHKASFWTKTRRKTCWMLAGLLAPELVVVEALHQRREARLMMKSLSQHFGGEPVPSWPRALWRWLRRRDRDAQRWQETEGNKEDAQSKAPISMTQGFYYGMGGLAINCTKVPGLGKALKHGRFVLTSYDLRNILEEGSFPLPLVSHEDIMDKSKANSLVKAVACIQALWFCLQFLTRLGEGLPISLLELNTFAHALCALLVYHLWWHKPLDIDQPTLTQPPSHEEQESEAFRDLVYRHTGFYEFEEKQSGGDAWKSVWLHCRDVLCFRWNLPLEKGSMRTLRPAHPRGLVQKFRGQHGFDSGAVLVRPDIEWLFADEGFLDGNKETHIQQRASQRVGNATYWPDVDLIDVFWSVQWEKTGKAAIITSSLFYGGLHSLAWGSATIHSSAELKLWIISCLTILISGPAWILISILTKTISHRFFFDASINWDSWHDFGVGTLMFLTLLLYVFSRTFLVVEVFLNVPYMDAGVFSVPTWPAYWPHIG